MSGITISNLSKTYKGQKRPALEQIDLEIKNGESFGLIGPNGAGKTTLMGCLLGLVDPQTGTIKIDGCPADSIRVRRMTGYMPERTSFEKWMCGTEFLCYHHELARQPAETRSADVSAALSRVDLDHDYWDQPIRKYSKGMLQRLSLAQALIGKPSFLFLDEPTSGLDPVGVKLMLDVLQQLRTNDLTMIISSHELGHVERICNRVAFLRAGKIDSIEDLQTPPTGEMFYRIRWLVASSEDMTAEKLTLLTQSTGAQLHAFGSGQATFRVAGEAMKARLLQSLALSGLEITDAIIEGGRLEQLFLQNPQNMGKNEK